MDTEDAELRRRLVQAWKLPENAICADCTSPAPQWASGNLGIFLCIRCSGIHRNLGTHISQVRSVTMDKWISSHVEACCLLGNTRSNMLFEAGRPASRSRPTESSDARFTELFIRSKYVDQDWLHPAARKFAHDHATRVRTDPSKSKKSAFPKSFLVAFASAVADAVASPNAAASPSVAASPATRSKKSRSDATCDADKSARRAERRAAKEQKAKSSRPDRGSSTSPSPPRSRAMPVAPSTSGMLSDPFSPSAAPTTSAASTGASVKSRAALAALFGADDGADDGGWLAGAASDGAPARAVPVEDDVPAAFRAFGCA